MMNHRTIATLLILATVHCTGSEAGHDAATDAATDAADGGACNALVHGSFVSPVLVDGVVPAFTGGTIADGEYVLTAVRIYNSDARGDGGALDAGGLLPDVSGAPSVHAGVLAMANQGRTGDAVRATSTFTTAGNELTLAQTCAPTSTAIRRRTSIRTTVRDSRSAPATPRCWSTSSALDPRGARVRNDELPLRVLGLAVSVARRTVRYRCVSCAR